MSVNSFLAVNRPLGQGVLVVEAWIPRDTLAESARLFATGKYQCLVLVGGPVEETGGGPNKGSTSADLAEADLERIGFDHTKLVKIRMRSVASDRTLATARVFEGWVVNSQIPTCCVDVFTVGVHARKSWVLFEYVLGGRYRVGIVAGHETQYNSKLWFMSKRGCWIVLRNIVGYAYYRSWIFLNRKHSPNPRFSSQMPISSR